MKDLYDYYLLHYPAPYMCDRPKFARHMVIKELARIHKISLAEAEDLYDNSSGLSAAAA